MTAGSAPTPSDRQCFGDEIAIDFPSMKPVVERMRDGLLGREPLHPARCTQVHLSRREAFDGISVPIEIGMPRTCGRCGGRGESWAEPCDACAGSGARDMPHLFTLSVPAGVADGACFHFVVIPPQGLPTRIEVTVAVG